MPVFHHAVLRRWRTESGMSPEESAYRAHCSLSYLRRLEAIGGNPSAELAARLAALYGHDINELFTDGAEAAGEAAGRPR